MSMSIDRSTNEKQIKFNKSSLLKISDFTFYYGNVTFNTDSIVMGASSRISATLDIRNKKLNCEYFKIKLHITSSDTTLSSENGHNVTGRYRFIYKDSYRFTNCYFPCFDFEEIYDGDYTVISSYDSKLNYIYVDIYNNENATITITDVGLYYKKRPSKSSIVGTDDSIIDNAGSVKYYTNTPVTPTPTPTPDPDEDDYTGSMYYLVPEMTLAQFKACDKTKYNECIIIIEEEEE